MESESKTLFFNSPDLVSMDECVDTPITSIDQLINIPKYSIIKTPDSEYSPDEYKLIAMIYAPSCTFQSDVLGTDLSEFQIFTVQEGEEYKNYIEKEWLYDLQTMTQPEFEKKYCDNFDRYDDFLLKDKFNSSLQMHLVFLSEYELTTLISNPIYKKDFPRICDQSIPGWKRERYCPVEKLNNKDIQFLASIQNVDDYSYSEQSSFINPQKIGYDDLFIETKYLPK